MDEDMVRRIVQEELAEVTTRLEWLKRAAEDAGERVMPALLSAEQAAIYLGGDPLTPRTILNLARAQRIGYVKIGRSTKFSIAALDEYIEARTTKPVDNPWGLTDAALKELRSGRSSR